MERYLGLQRPLNADRVRKIRRYLESPDASFPTSIIIAVDGNCAEFDPRSGNLTLSAFDGDGDQSEAIPFEKIGKVLDGQHRLAGFLDQNKKFAFPVTGEGPATFDLNVALFIGADLPVQASIFATVNLAQTKVSRSLAYDLEDFARARSPFKTCHNIAVAMNKSEKSPLFRRIKRLGVKTKGVEGETLTQASFVEALVPFISKDPITDRNRLLEGKPVETDTSAQPPPLREMWIRERDLEIAQVVNNFFKAVADKWPNAWNDYKAKGNLLPRTNAFKALMKFLLVDIFRATPEIHNTVPTVEFFSKFFEGIELSDKDFTTRTFVPGSGGQATFLKILRRTVDPKELFE